MYCKVTERLFEIFHLLEEEKKKPKDYGGDVLLYHAEVMLLDVIARHPGDKIGRLADRMGITKGAITQMAGKLQQKELIEITKREDNKKEKYVQLTDKGRQAVAGHHQFHRQANEELCAHFSTLSREENEIIFQFLDRLKQSVPFCEFQCGCNNESEKEEAEHEANAAQCLRFTRSH